MSYLRGVWAIACKDLRSESRTLERLSSMALLALTIQVLFRVAFEPAGSEAADLAAGALWVTLPLAAVLGLHDSLRSEREDQGMWALLLAPVDESAIYLGKLLPNFLLLAALGGVVMALNAVFFNLGPGSASAALALVLLLNVLGFAALGTLFATLSSRARRGEMLLHLLLLPLAIPLILAAVRSTTPLLRGQALPQVWLWLKLSLTMDVVFITAGVLLFEYLVEE